MTMTKIHSLGTSGGRTSMYLSILFHLGKTGLNDNLPHEFIFCDTGAEDKGTYKFLRDAEKHLGIKITCLQSEVNEKHGKGNDFKVVDINSLKFDMSIMEESITKYGGFTNNRPWCTDKFKTIISTKYRDKAYGKNGCYTWIGIRYDEPKRLVGCHRHHKKSAYKQLIEFGYSKEDITELFRDLCRDEWLLDIKHGDLPELTKELLRKRRAKQKALGLRYLAEISDFTKQDVIDFFKDQPFDLETEEHRGNCLFCIKKSELKVALAARECPEEFEQWKQVVTSPNVREMPADKFGIGHIYRGWLTPDKLIAQFESSTTEELRERIYKTKQFDSGSCTESCEAFGDLDEE